MSDELQLQQRLYRETEKAHRAYMDYREMGINRSLRKLHESYIAPDSPRDRPTRNLSTIEGWSSRFQWQDRIAEWEQFRYARAEAEAEKYRHAEREKRAEMLEKFRKRIESQMFMADLSEEGVDAFKALTSAMKAYADISMKHYNDLPTKRQDITSDNKPLSVSFVTEPIPEDLVRQRLAALGLADHVDEQSE
ncbi:MAG: hypothetical protein ACFE0Q_20880 [Anaerolineae bacterium]